MNQKFLLLIGMVFLATIFLLNSKSEAETSNPTLSFHQAEIDYSFEHKGNQLKTSNVNNNIEAAIQSDKIRLTENNNPLSDWKADFVFQGIFRGNQKVFDISEAVFIETEDNKATIDEKDFLVEYINSEEGVRQNFIVKNKPVGSGNLKVQLKIESNLSAELINSKELKLSKGSKSYSYKDLNVWDAKNRRLDASMEWDNDHQLLALVVDDTEAVYPVTIDPVFSAELSNISNNSSVAAMGALVTGLDLYWIGAAGTQDFNDPANWSTTDPAVSTTVAISPPSAQDDIYFVDASFPAGGAYVINCTGTQNVRHIRFVGLGSATTVNFAGSGILNHYGDFILLNDDRLSVGYAGTLVETYNSSFSPSRRIFDLQDRYFLPAVTVELPTTDTVDVISVYNSPRLLNHYHGTMIIRDTLKLGLLRIRGTTNANNFEARHFNTSGHMIFSGVNLGSPLYGVVVEEFGFSIDTVNIQNGTVITSSNSVILFNSTPVKIDLESVSTLDTLHTLGIQWANGTIKKITAGNWNISQYPPTIDTLESKNINAGNSSNNQVLKLKKLIYPEAGCGEYANFLNTNFSWQDGLPASLNAAGDTLRGVFFESSSSRDATNTVLTGDDRSLLFGSKEILSTGISLTTGDAGRDLYWIGGTGDWSDISHWSLSSGGAPIAVDECPPTFADNVFFDANSFSAVGQSMTMTTASECHNMTWDNLAFTDINWTGSGLLNLYGSMILDVNMQKTVSYSGQLHLWGTEDSLFFESGSVDARLLPDVVLFPRKNSHYDVTSYADLNHVNYSSNTTSGSPTYLSFADTIQLGPLSGGSFTNPRPGFTDTIDLAKNNTQWYLKAGTFMFRGNPRMLHTPEAWIIIQNASVFPYQAFSSNSTNGRWPNTLVRPGGTINHRFSNWTCEEFHISAYSEDSSTVQTSYTFMNSGSSTGGINCRNFRTLDTLVQNLYIGKNTNALRVVDSLVIEREGGCLTPNLLSSGTTAQAGLTLTNPDKVRMSGTSFQRFNYLGVNQPFDATVNNFDGGGNANIIFGPDSGGATTYYWRKNPVTNSYNGSWELSNNWTLDPNAEFGQGAAGCPPSATDSLVIDNASSDGLANYTIDAANDFAFLALNARTAPSSITLTGNGAVTIGGSLLLGDDINWSYNGNIISDFSGERTWELSNKYNVWNLLTHNGGTLKFDGATTQRLRTSDHIEITEADAELEINAVPYVSLHALYAPSKSIVASNCTFFEVRSYHLPAFSGSGRGISVSHFEGTGTNLYIRYGDSGNNFSGTFDYAYFLGGPIYGTGSQILHGNTLEIGEAVIFNNLQTTVNEFIANSQNPGHAITWQGGGPDTISNSYISSPNTTFSNKVVLGETKLQSDRTHTFPAGDTTYFLPNGSLEKIGDLSKVINFRSTSTGSQAFLTKPTGGNIYLCNIDARDVATDSIPNSEVFRTNDLSVLNNSPGWDVISPGSVTNITSWDTLKVDMFRGDSTFVGFSWDPTSLGPYRVIYEEQGYGLDSIQVNDGVLNKQILFGGYSDSLLLGQTVSKHFECPGIFVADSVNAELDTVFIHVPETENGLSTYNKGGRYFYKNLDTWVYMMDSVDYLTTAAFYDKLSGSDQDSLGQVTTHVDGQATTIIDADRYYVPRTYEMNAQNDVATKVRLFFSKAEVDAMKLTSDYITPTSNNPTASNPNISADVDFLSSLTVGSFPNGQLFDQAAETTISSHSSGLATAVDSNTYYVEFEAPLLQSFAVYRACVDTTDIQDTICANTTLAFNNQLLSTSGIYLDTLLQVSGCDSIIRLDLFVRPENILSATTIEPVCNGQATGSIDLSTSLPGTFTYAWSDGSTNEDLFNVAATTYDVTVTDENSCTFTLSVNLTEPTAMALSTSVTDVDCNGNTTGAIDLTVSGGTAGYTFSWGDGETTEDLSGLAPNTYYVTVTDANGCTANTSATVAEPTVLLCNIAGTNPTIFGGSNGSADATINGGSAPFTYAWSNGATTEDVTGLMADTYTLTVTDANNCTTSCTVTLTEPGALSCSLAGTDLLCFENNMGAVTTTIDGGTSPYTYAWSNGETTQNLSALAAGTYTLTVTDAASATSSCNITLIQAPELTVSFSQTDAACNGGATGAIDLTATGGTGMLTYAWSNGATTEDVSALAANTYSVTVTDANSCSAETTVMIAEPTSLMLSSSKVDVACHGLATGSIDLTVSGGTPTYLFNWSHGEAIEDVSDLLAGTYTVTVTDANNCTAETTVVIAEPAGAITLIATPTDIACNAATNGAIDLMVSGGTVGAGYTFVWSNGATTEDLSALAAGTYKVTVTDANTCQDSLTVVVNESDAISIDVAKMNVDCNGNMNGSIDLNVTGGNPTYTFAWSNGATTEDLSTLAAGTYTVTVTDASICTATATTTIIEPALGTHPPAALCAATVNVYAFDYDNKTYEIVRESKTWADAAACAVARGGQLVVIDDQAENDKIFNELFNNAYITLDNTTAPDGGGGAYAWIGANDIATEGTWIWDGDNDGTGVNFFTGDAFTGMPVGGAFTNWGTSGMFPSEPDNFGGNQNAAAMGISAWPLPDPGPGFRLGDPGQWNDVNATNTLYYIIEYPDVKTPYALDATVALDSSATCLLSADGGATATAIEGAAPYSYSWSNGATPASLSGVTGGNYSVTVTDANGCSASDAVEITNDIAGCDSCNDLGPDVSLVYAITDGTTNTTNFLWDDSNSPAGNVPSTQQHGVYRGTQYCEKGEWRHYYSGDDDQKFVISIEMGSNTTEIEYVEIRVAETPGALYDTIPSNAFFAMSRDWFVKTVNDDPLTAPVNLRFYYVPDELKKTLDDAIALADTDSTAIAPTAGDIVWFKKDTYDPGTDISADGTGVTGGAGYVEMTPEVAPDANGVAETEVSDLGNNINYVQFNGITGFSGGGAFVSITGTTLPVELSEFYGRGEGCAVDLHWKVAAEDNFSHYEVEKSKVGIDFEGIGRVDKQVSNDGMEKVYHFEDRQPGLLNYYRLKMVDLDGTYEYSDVIVVKTSCEKMTKESQVLFYPNPLEVRNALLKVEFFTNDTEVQLAVYNTLGSKVKAVTLSTETGWNKVSLDMNDLDSGSYFIQLSDAQGISRSAQQLILIDKR